MVGGWVWSSARRIRQRRDCSRADRRVVNVGPRRRHLVPSWSTYRIDFASDTFIRCGSQPIASEITFRFIFRQNFPSISHTMPTCCRSQHLLCKMLTKKKDSCKQSSLFYTDACKKNKSQLLRGAKRPLKTCLEVRVLLRKFQCFHKVTVP